MKELSFFAALGSMFLFIYWAAEANRQAKRATKQRDDLLAALQLWMPAIRAHTQASHLTDGFRPRRNDNDDKLDQAVQAIQQATDQRIAPTEPAPTAKTYSLQTQINDLKRACQHYAATMGSEFRQINQRLDALEVSTKDKP